MVGKRLRRSRYIKKDTLIKTLKKLGVSATNDDTVMTLRPRLTAALKDRGYKGLLSDIDNIKRFANDIHTADTWLDHVLIKYPRKSSENNTRNIKIKTPDEIINARKVISSINNKPLPRQSIETMISPDSKKSVPYVVNSREFTINFNGKNDSKFRYLWNSVMIPFLKKLTATQEWLIITTDDIQGDRYHTINIDNVDSLRDSFENSGLINIDDDLTTAVSGQLDSSLFFGGRNLTYMNKIRFIDITDYNHNSIYKRLRTHHFFPYTHNIPYLDLSEYQIYKRVEDYHNAEHCVVYALKQYGIDVTALIPNNYHKITAITELGTPIYLREYDGKNNHYIGDKTSNIKLVSYYNHCMIDKKVMVTEYYLNNCFTILSDRLNTVNWNSADLLQIAGRRIDGGKTIYYKTRKPKYINIEKVIDILFANHSFTAVPLYDLLNNTDNFNNPTVSCHTREINSNRNTDKYKVEYVNEIPFNPSRSPRIKHGKVISEIINTANGKVKRIDYHNIIPNVTLNQFNEFIEKLPFNIGSCDSYAGISHKLFTDNVYTKVGVKEITGNIINELDRFRIGGLFFANKCYINEPVIQLDVNSLFPYVMRNIKLPVGNPIFGETALNCDVFYARVIYKGKELLLTNYSDNIDYDEICFAVGWKGESSELMADLIDNLYNMRLENRDTEYADFYKGLLTCPYGKTMARAWKSVPKIVETSNAHNYLLKNLKVIKSFRKYDDNHIIFYKYKQFNQWTLLHVGLQVVYAARKFMENIIKNINVPVYYCQIDSLLLTVRDYNKIKDLLKISDKIGDFKTEYCGDYAYIIGKGSYLLYNNANNYKIRLIGKTRDFIDNITDPLSYFKSLL